MIKKDDRLRPSVPGRTLGSSAPNERQGVDRDRGSAADLRRDAVGHIPRRRPASQPRDRSANRNKLRRTTGDADDIVFATLAEADSLIGQAAAAVFDVREEVERERLATTGAVRFRKGRFQIDLITASLPFEEMAYERASRHELFGIPLPFPSPEDLILLKALAGRDKDMLDATGVARRHSERLDVRYLEATLRPLCELAEDMTPWARLQRVLAVVRSPDEKGGPTS